MTAQTENDCWLKPDAAAAHIGVTTQKLKNFRIARRSGIGDPGPDFSQPTRKSIRYRKSDLDRYMESKKESETNA